MEEMVGCDEHAFVYVWVGRLSVHRDTSVVMKTTHNQQQHTNYTSTTSSFHARRLQRQRKDIKERKETRNTELFSRHGRIDMRSVSQQEVSILTSSDYLLDIMGGEGERESTYLITRSRDDGDV
jgi:hypothetical protein